MKLNNVPCFQWLGVGALRFEFRRAGPGLAILIACLALQACATGPTAQQSLSLESNIASANFAAVATDAVKIGKIDAKGDGDLQWKLTAGAASLHGNDNKNALKYLDMADLDVKKAEVGTKIIDSNYDTRVHDKSMIGIYKALAYLGANDKENARITFNQADDQQRRAEDILKNKNAKALEESRKKHESGGFDLAASLVEIEKNSEYKSNINLISEFATYKD